MGISKVVLGNRTLIDLSNITVTPETLGEGVTAFNAQGELITGTMKPGPATMTVLLNGAPNEVITYTGTQNDSITLDFTGVGSLQLDAGVYTFSGGISGYQKTVEIRQDSIVNVWPNGTMVYWYGRKFYTPTASKYMPSGETTNGKAPTITEYDTYFNVKQPAVSGNYCGSALFQNIVTKGGVPTVLSSGKLNTNSSPPNVYFCIADSITTTQFSSIQKYPIAYQETDVKLNSVADGTYTLAISVRNNAQNYHGHVDVYAIYFEE